MFGDPGIKENIFDHYRKIEFKEENEIDKIYQRTRNENA
jgi:hypothetical protein